MPVHIVQSKQNGRLKLLRQVLAQSGRHESGLVGIEGPNLVAEAIRAGLRVQSVFAALGMERDLEALDLPQELDVLMMPRELLVSALATEAPQPLAALLEPPEWTWAHILGIHKASAPLIVVLAGLQDPGNLGTILRSAEAFGADGVIALPGTVSEWNPKAVRASAGSVFRLPVIAATKEQMLANLREAGVKILTTAANPAEPAGLGNLVGPVALVIGNEGNGVPLNLAAKTDGATTIPCPGPVESLNAAVAASVLLYEASRQRSLETGGPQHRRGSAR